MTLILALFGAFTLTFGDSSHRWLLGIGAVVALAAAAPLLAAIATVCLSAARLWRRASRKRRAAAKTRSDVVVLAELTSMALNAGLSFPAALAAAAEHVEPALGAEARGVLRRGRSVGLGWELLQAKGEARRLYHLAGRAMSTGAPLAASVDMYVSERRHAERTEAETEARKLPVKLLFPLALLMLPGFLIITVGPILLGALQRLSL